MSDKPKIWANCKAGCAWETVHYSDFMKSASYIKRSLNNGAGVMDIGTKYRIKSATKYSGITSNGTTETAAALLLAASAYAAVGNRIYMFGSPYGWNSAEGAEAGKVIRYYDVDTGEVVVCSAVNTFVTSNMAAAAVGTKVYLFGGNQDVYAQIISHFSYPYILEYDTVTDTLTKLNAELPDVESGMFACAVGKKIYVKRGNGNYDYVYDTETGVLYQDDESEDIAEFGVAAVGDYIYRIGGALNGYRENTISKSHIDSFAGGNTVANLPYAITSPKAAAVGTKIYIFGGNKGDGVDLFSPSILVFDTVTNKVEDTGATLAEMWTFRAVTVGTNIYIFSTNNDNGYSAAVDTYIPETGYKAAVTLLQDETGVYTFPIQTYDKYRDTFYFELLAVADEGIVYEVNGERFIDKVEGINADAKLSLMVSGATELFINNAEAMISAETAAPELPYYDGTVEDV